ncbi:MAG TPA: MazG nucleotide pyrophosphohydrolase domain-containing protein [Bacillota bacterium]|nr:MazG nucleotide pyrophosphohydrolase domain-containing protein [Bacillota bacterium]HNT04166.1 MazG nucleotide pyrophosphohydrolase domain-containing protein [Bacillota bacterium]HNU79551.1 MazG nucleotide pyrophosphohydrolase domain-containing protein [Bacillota bacterium]HPA55253.1 MazG nucleotide pyrophosphohydrolase domain-containing protein [Bacillota bacterium]HPM00210.1 MazG nucleotide pyrophosphohydrolase domain-containing protein [Bacillota bacterium]
MKDLLYDNFQDSVGELLVRHKSILDVLTKYQESQSRVSRAVVKAVTSCGCIEINSKKQNYDNEITLQELKNYMDTHLKGSLCANCRDVIEKELGNNLFYIAALCNIMDISMYDVLLKEYEKMHTLGIYNLF